MVAALFPDLLCSVLMLCRYRLRGTCHTCPDTAWLLFLLFALAITFFVAVAVWLGKKKINLAGMSIGVEG